MGQLERISRQVTALNSKLARLTAEPKPTICSVFATTSKRRDAGDLLSVALCPRSFAKAVQQPALGSDALFQTRFGKGYPEYSADQPRDESGQWTSGGSTGGEWEAGSPGVEIRSDALSYPRPWSLAVKAITLTAVGAFLVMQARNRWIQYPVSLVAAKTPLGRSVTLFTDGRAPNAVASILRGVDLIPAAHYAALQKSGLRFVAVRSLGPITKRGSGFGGLYVPNLHAILMPEKISALGINVPFVLTSKVRTNLVVHEFAHALDFVGHSSGRSAWMSVRKELNALLATPRGKEALKFWMRAYDPRIYGRRIRTYEAFAEVYSAKYVKDPGWLGHFGHLSRDQILKAFSKTSAEIDNLRDVTPGTFSRLTATARARTSDYFDRVGFDARQTVVTGLPPRPFFPKRAVSKGYPEYSADQPRDESGRWSAGGVALAAGGALAAAAVTGLGVRGVLRRQAAQQAAQRAEQQAQGRRAVEVWFGAKPAVGGTFAMRNLTSADQVRSRMASFFPGSTTAFQQLEGGAWAGVVKAGDDLRGLFVLDPAKQQLFVNLMKSSDTPAGFDASKRYMLMLLAFARDSGAKSITAAASMEMGGYAWPRAGFEVTERSMGLVKQAITARLDQLSSSLTADQVSRVRGMLATFDKGTPAKLARLDDAVPMGAMRTAGDVRGRPTLGKALLAGTEGEYVLPRSKFAPMGKALAKALGYTKGYPEFDPNQARDEGGQWTAGGGSTGGGGEGTEWKVGSPGVKVRSDAPKRPWPWKAVIAGVVLGGATAYLALRVRGQLIQRPVQSLATKTPLGRNVTLFTDGHAPIANRTILRAVDLIPAAHYAALEKSGLRFVTVNTMGFKRISGSAAPSAFYSPMLHAIIIPESLAAAPILYSGTRMLPVVVHEMAHALDFTRGVAGQTLRFSGSMHGEFTRLAGSSGGAQRLAEWTSAYGRNDLREVFAEVYAAKYTKGVGGLGHKYFFALTQSEMVQAFPESMAKLDKISKFTPGVFSRTFISTVRRIGGRMGVHSEVGIPPLR